MEKYELRVKPKRIQDLVEGYQEGMSLKAACALAFLRDSQVFRWMRMYNEYLAKLDSGEETNTNILEVPVDENDCLIYKKLNILTLCIVLTHARADCQRTYLKFLKEDDDHWQKWSWLLERTFRKEFGKDLVEDNQVKQVEKIQVVYVDSQEDSNRLAKLESEVKESLGIDGNNN